MVYSLLKTVDPDGIDLRKKGKLKRRIYYSVGPDETWSMDGHDKLVKFGLAIHGAVDVWSGKFIWLRVFTSNHEPRLIAKYFVEAIAENKRFPYSIRSDCGTETVEVSSIIKMLHAQIASGVLPEDSYRYVPSTRNQRIESAWSRYLNAIGKNIQDTIQEGFDTRVYNDQDALEKYIFLYVWLPLVQKELDHYARQVNTHNRQKSKSGQLPTVAPNICYTNPEAYGATRCSFEVPESIMVSLLSDYSLDDSLDSYLPSYMKRACDYIIVIMGNLTVELSNAWSNFSNILDVFLLIASSN